MFGARFGVFAGDNNEQSTMGGPMGINGPFKGVII